MRREARALALALRCYEESPSAATLADLGYALRVARGARHAPRTGALTEAAERRLAERRARYDARRRNWREPREAACAVERCNARRLVGAPWCEEHRPRFGAA